MEIGRLTRDGTLPNLSREIKFSVVNGDREMFIFPVQLAKSRIGNLTRLIHTLLYVMTILSTCPLHINSWYGKERRMLIGSW